MFLKTLKPRFRYTQKNRSIYTKTTVFFGLLIGLVQIIGCTGQTDSMAKSSGSSQRAKPEGLLLITRELDLGTLPAGGSIESLLAIKNPDEKTAIELVRYEINRSGLQIDPKRMSIPAQSSNPIHFLVTPEGTQTTGDQTWEVTGWDAQERVAFRTTLKLKVVVKVAEKSVN